MRPSCSPPRGTARGLARLLPTLVLALCLTHAYALVVMVLNSGEGTVSLIDRATMQENDLVFLDPRTGQLGCLRVGKRDVLCECVANRL
jgi:hypothetical protein